ncbi:Hypothetical predicted protein [Paramuricea clavata]|uniref:Uncharacterized protein n=1 Tax=Paramuricea clavata TaxID=317549 RepID=A0A6S7FXD7_PARCT|nr:Hypothetical predicted protein [Paramuricea clavata]
MREIHAESVRIAEDDELEAVITHTLQLVALQNGVANCSRHALGCMVRAVHERHVDDEGNEEKRIGATLDQLQGDLNDAQYVLYGASLEKCGCDECTACMQFDEMYNEFYDQLEENGKVSNAQPPSIEDRPLHCVDNEMMALNVKSKFAGLSSSSLENTYYFAQLTTAMSPPTISTATPTVVMGTTTKYLAPYLRNRKLQDPLPKCWKTNEPVPPAERLVKLSSCIRIAFTSMVGIRVISLTATKVTNVWLSSPSRKLAVRTWDNDAPEMAFAVRFYKQYPTSTAMHHIITRHIGLESLRAVRQMVFEAKEVYKYIHNSGFTLSLLAI